MKICLVSPEPFFPLTGGGTIGTLKIVEKMVNFGHEVHVITPLYFDKKLIEKKFSVKLHPFTPFIIKKDENLQVRRFKNLLWGFLSFFKINKVVKLNDIDLVFARNFVAGIGARINKLVNGTPYVVSVTDITSGYFYDQYKLPKKIIDFFIKAEILSMKAADKIFVVTKEMKKIFIKNGVPKKKIKVIYDGVEIEKFNPSLETKLKKKLGLNKYRIIFFHGTMEKHMGLYSLIDAMEDAEGDIKLILVGSGPILHELKKYAREKNLKNVVFLGKVDYNKIPEYISIADVCVVPYPSNFSTNLILTLKLLEYAAMKKPIICSDLKGIREVFKDKRDLIFYRSGDKKDLIEKINLILNNKKLSNYIKVNARKIVEKKLNWENITESIIKELDRL